MKQAILEYRLAIRLDEQYTYAYVSLGDALRDDNDLDGAIAAYKKALSLKNTAGDRLLAPHSIAYNGLGLILQKQEKLTDASEAFQLAMNVDPRNEEASLNKVENEKRLKRVKESTIDSPLQDWKAIKRSIFQVTTYFGTTPSQGTAWMYKRKGNTALVLTNRHVICTNPNLKNSQDTKPYEKYSDIKLKLYGELDSDSLEHVKIKLLIPCDNSSSDIDLTFLEVKNLPDDIKPLSIIDKIPTKLSNWQGMKVRIIGSPNTTPSDFIEDKAEVFDANNKSIYVKNSLQGEGASGSPVFNEDRQVIGIVSSIDSPFRWTSGRLNIIPINVVEEVEKFTN